MSQKYEAAKHTNTHIKVQRHAKTLSLPHTQARERRGRTVDTHMKQETGCVSEMLRSPLRHTIM